MLALEGWLGTTGAAGAAVVAGATVVAGAEVVTGGAGVAGGVSGTPFWLGQARFLTKYTESDAMGVPSWLRTLSVGDAHTSQNQAHAGRCRQGTARSGSAVSHHVHSAVVLLMKSMMPCP